MLSQAARYLAALLVFGVGDAIWLSWFGPNVVQPALGSVLRDPVDWRTAIVFYLLYPVGVLFFAVSPALAAHDIKYAALAGVLFGFFGYMTYDLTNLATIAAWTPRMALLDICWGAFISGAMALAGYAAGQAIR
jgi:uncharacterized membrane protein